MMPELRDWLTIGPLLFLAGREALQWIYGREAIDSSLTRQVQKLQKDCAHLQQQLDTEAADRRKLWHDLDNRMHAILVTVAVTQQRVQHLEDDRG